MTRLDQTVTWEASGNARLPYQATVDGARWQVWRNEQPDGGILFALLVDGQAVEEFTDWPPAWTRPPERDDDAYERGVYEHEMAKLEHQKGIKPSKLVK